MSEQKSAEIIDLKAEAMKRWESDFKERWKGQAEDTDEIWGIQEWLEELGWSVKLYDTDLPEFHTFVDFSKKIVRNNNVKAYHARHALRAVVGNVLTHEVGRMLFYWEEVHDEEHRHVRDQEEWKGSELYGTVWYSREMRSRELSDDEEPPVRDNSDAIINLEPRIS